MESLVATVLVVAVLCLGCVTGQFTPGCSFVGGNCMYTVQLGHQGQCDAAPVSSTGSGSSESSTQCCDSLKNDITSIKSTLHIHEQQLESLQTQLTLKQNELDNAALNISHIEQERDALLATLARKEAELNNTQAEMARILHKSSQEIQNLRADLTNSSKALSNCQAALGITTSSSGQPASLAGDVNTFYCPFDKDGDCGFQHLSGTTDFQLMQHGSSSSTGPRHDHSTGAPGGHYMSINAFSIASRTTSQSEKVALYESPVFDPANSYCIYFWYSMRGSDVRNLDVNVRIGGGTGYPVWSKSGNQNADWSLGHVELDSEYTANPFKIDFKATTNAYKKYSSSYSDYVNYNEYGDIGIDDLYVYNTTCGNIPKCPSDSHKYTYASSNVTSCYTFHSTPMKWEDAYDTCRKEGPWSGLVSIETQEEQNFLVNYIKADTALSMIGQNGFYTSGNDINTEHKFVWTDTGSERAVDSFGWHTGQPNNVGGNQDCLLMEYSSDDYSWGDVVCSSTHPFICEVYYKE